MSSELYTLEKKPLTPPCLGCSPLTGRVYIILRTRSDGSVSKKVDVTEQVIASMEWLNNWRMSFSLETRKVEAPKTEDLIRK